MGRHIYRPPFNYIFHVNIEQDQTDGRNLVYSILQLEALSSTAEVQSIMHALQEIHLVNRNYMFILHNPVETVEVDRVIGRFVVYKDATFILMFLE